MASAINSDEAFSKGEGAFNKSTAETNIYDAGRINRGVAARAFTPEADKNFAPQFAPQRDKYTEGNYSEYKDEDLHFVEQQSFLSGGEHKIGVIFDTYILIEGKDEIFLLDQHAAHERILYDKLTSKNYSGFDQLLLIPYVFEVNHLEREYLADILPELNKMGFSIEEFGTNSFKINTVPGALWDIDLKDFVFSLLGDTSIKRLLSEKDLLKEKLAKNACKAAVKGGEKLPDAEIDKLVKILSSGGNIPVCPHGRPIAVKLKRSEIEKWFRRIVK